MTVTREQVGLALFALLKTSYTYKTSSRRFRTWTQLQSADKPALFQIEHKESHLRGKTSTTALRTLDVDIYIFISPGLDQNITPITLLNTILDAIDPVSGGVLAPNNPQNRQTLGGLVYDCFIDGEIVKVPGDLDGQGVGIIPIKIIFHQAS